VLTIATAVTLIRGVSGRVRGSRIKRFILWILATPTIIAAALLGLMGLLSAVFGQDEFGAMLLIMLVLFGVVAGGMVLLLCAFGFVALLVSGSWIAQHAPALGSLVTYAIVGLQAGAVVSLAWAVAGRTRGSLIKSILLWILAAPTILVSLVLALLMIAVMNKPQGNDDVILVVIPALGVIGTGAAAMLVLAALPVKRPQTSDAETA